MHNLLIKDPLSLSLLMTEDLYWIAEKRKYIEENSSQNIVQKVEKLPLVKEKEKELFFEYLGENNSYFLILIEDKTSQTIDPTRVNILLKIIQAKGLTLKDIAILNYANYPDLTFEDLKAFFACNRIVLFGINPHDLKLPIMSANELEIFQQVKILPTYSLEEMETDQRKKRQHWEIMKKF